MHCTVNGVELKPTLALGGGSRSEDGQRSDGYGDLVLRKARYSSADKIAASGIEQTAIHNHVLNESPRVMYMQSAVMVMP